LFYANAIKTGRTQVRQVIFSDIMPALQRHQANFGVCIHEGRFTWQAQGLFLVEDLGVRWEQATGQPLPLGGILARRSMPLQQLRCINNLIRESLEYGLQHREETIPTMRRYAQELNDEVLFQHVDLYVNPWTIDLADTGRAALESLYQFAISSGTIATGGRALEVLSTSQ
jgi:1,4-dihydroxy-6-naphthoate synthase